jgi:phosphopantothenoylcysteine decarboxylase/phosphopantothenate--cysteine ligase
MGFALAEAYAGLGAEVMLVSGPGAMLPLHKNIKVVSVTSASEMLRAAESLIDRADIAVFAAAVADFTPAEPADKKMKREKDELVIRLKPTVDIAAELGRRKRSDQLFVGFALETNDGLKNAEGKLKRKNLDLIVLNSLEDEGAGFGTETNKITMIDKSGNIDTFGLKLKSEVALDIVDKTIKMLQHA